MMENIPYSQIIEKFGEPGKNSNHIWLTLPFPLKASWDETIIYSKFYGHEYIARDVILAFAEILNYYGINEIRKQGLDNYGGCFNKRKSAGSNRWSVHSWGLAIDYLVAHGPFRKPATTPAIVVQAFKKRGFLWGGDWALPDGMHFTVIKE